METVRTFRFVDNDDELVLEIPEKAEAAYGMYTWPCAVVLAQYLWHNRKKLAGKNILELGAGTSLPGVLASKCIDLASITLTDDNHQPMCLENCRKTCSRNSLSCNIVGQSHSQPTSNPKAVKIMGLTWGEVSPQMLSIGSTNEANSIPYPDIILGSDCFFEESLYGKVLFTVHHLLRGQALGKPGSESPRFLCTYQMRSAKSSLEDLLLMWGLTCRQIPLSTFDAYDDDIAESGLPGNHEVQMLEITLV